MQAVINFLNGIANAIDSHAGAMRAAGMNVGMAIIDGMTFGLASKAAGLFSKISGIMDHAMSLVHKIPLVGSPSKVTMNVGEEIINGLVVGLDANAQNVYSSATEISNGVINSFRDTFQTHSPSKVMADIGKDVGTGFAQGLKGSKEEIRGAFEDLNGKLLEAMKTANATIAEEQAKLNKLLASNKPEVAAIKEAQKLIDENKDILERTTAAHQALITTLTDEKRQLVGLSIQYDSISEKLKNAQQVLAEAIQTRDQAVKSFTDKYSTLPAITTEDAEGNAIDQLAAYEDALKHQTDAVGAYSSTLQQLRKLGLDDATYQKLLDDGTMDAAFAEQLLAGGRTAVESLNTLDANLMKVSKTLAKNAGDNLYQAGIDAAEGLVQGLKSKRSDIRHTMEEIARDILTALKKELKIKSPSEEFAQIGTYSMEGLAKGFTDSSDVVAGAIDDAAADALTAMKKSIQGLNNVVAEELDPNLVLTPILDLTQVREQSQELASLANVTPITAATSYGQAAIISSQQTASQEAAIEVAPTGTSVVFEQNNYSPESLSEIDIYRQTKNQLSQLKSALALT
jgi:hypothetical protein